jgi:hypothetical protein
MLGWFLAARFE